jgi:hypothetical protein
MYTQHLASAALLFAAFQKGAADQLGKLVAEERRNYGISFLSGDVGQRAEAAFCSFADSLESWLAGRARP